MKQSCEERRKEAYIKRKELTRLQNKIIKMKQTVTSSSVISEKLQKMNLEKKDLRERLNTLLKQYKAALKEEEAVTLQKQKMSEE